MNVFKRLSIPVAILVLLAAAALPAAGQKTLSALLPEAAPALPEGIAGDDAATAFRIGKDLAVLAGEYEAHRRSAAAGPFAASNTLLRLRGDRVLIDTVAEGDVALLEKELGAAGLERAARYGRVVSGYLPITAIVKLPRLPGLRFARPSYAASGVGSVTSQGDVAMQGGDVRAEFTIDGNGVTVGTLSDSFDCLSGAAGDVGTMDLPAGIVVIDDSLCPNSDEGRAMMQIVADVAPGAAQGFHTAFGGQADFAKGIEELAGCPPGSAASCTPVPGFAADIINDDVFYFAEPFFQDGIIAQAVDNVVANGVSYFTLAGNHDRKSYEAPFVKSGMFEPDFGGELHDFDPGAGVDAFQSITVPVGASVTFGFQFDQPYFSVSGPPGSGSDHDIFVFDATGTVVLASGASSNIGGDPIEVFTFANAGAFDFDGVPGPDTTFNIGLSKFSGPDAGTMKYIALVNGALGSFTVNEFDTASGTIYGHMNSAGAVTVGAAFYFETPAFGTTPAVAEPFSSAGSLPILFDGMGLPIVDVRPKPDLVAPDGGNNTFFGSDIADPGDGSDTDSFPNFFGTSAATPHAAGAAALLLQKSNLTPEGVKQLMQAGAAIFDMGPAGFDDDTGHGYFVAAYAAYDATVESASWTGFCDLPSLTLTGVPNDGSQAFRAGSSITWGDGTFDDVEGVAPEHIFTDGFESGDTSSWSNTGC